MRDGMILLPAVMSAWLDPMHLLLICLRVMMMQCKWWSNCLLLSSRLKQCNAWRYIRYIYLLSTTSHLQYSQSKSKYRHARCRFALLYLWSQSKILLQVRVLKDQLDVLTRRLGVPLASAGSSRTAEDLWPLWDPRGETKTYHVQQNISSPWSEMARCTFQKIMMEKVFASN